ncbi:MAG: hypothetical protein ACPG42_09100 [Alphaproteobacteria bacterium]
MFAEFFNAFFSDESVKLRALDDLRRKSKGNDYLFADADLTSISTNGGSVVVHGLDDAAIHAAIEAFAVDRKKGEAREIKPLSGVYVIRTPTLRFPNGLSYWISDGDAPDEKRVSLYAWSVFGRRAYGVNRDYVTALARSLTTGA